MFFRAQIELGFLRALGSLSEDAHSHKVHATFPSLDLARAVELVAVLLDTLQHCGDVDAFEELWTEVVSTC